MSEHLSQSQLAAYSERKLLPDELLAVDSHLASCDECHERLPPIMPKASLESGEEPFHLDYDQHLVPYVDGKANDIDREIVESHVAQCSQCATELRDLLAFQEQPVAATTKEVRTSWFSPWSLLSYPASATAIVIAVFLLSMAALLWAMYPMFRRVEKVETRPPASNKRARENEQPSPASTEPTGQKIPAVPSHGEPLIVLNDAGGQIVVNQQGHLEGLHELPPDLRESVGRALATRRLSASPALTGWSSGAGSLRGGLENQSTFAPLEPTDMVVETDRPTFRWQALESALDYVVTIYDAKLRQVGSSGPVTGTEWTTPNALERGVIYSWQITALKDGKRVVTPKPPLPEARFRILDQPATVQLTKLKETARSSHLIMGLFYWKHGLIAESEREFQALAQANPNSAAVKELLANLRSHYR